MLLYFFCFFAVGDSPLEQHDSPRRLTLQMPDPGNLEGGSSESLLDTPVPDTPVTPLAPLSFSSTPSTPPDVTRSMMNLTRQTSGGSQHQAAPPDTPEEKAHTGVYLRFSALPRPHLKSYESMTVITYENNFEQLQKTLCLHFQFNEVSHTNKVCLDEKVIFPF